MSRENNGIAVGPMARFQAMLLALIIDVMGPASVNESRHVTQIRIIFVIGWGFDKPLGIAV